MTNSEVKRILNRIKKECAENTLYLNGEEWVKVDTVNQIVNDEISGVDCETVDEDDEDDEDDDYTWEDAVKDMYPNSSPEEIEEELGDRLLKD